MWIKKKDYEILKSKAEWYDRFNKVIKDKHDRIDKAIARLDKKMYKRRDPEKRGKWYLNFNKGEVLFPL